jgi:hypothetical protein
VCVVIPSALMILNSSTDFSGEPSPPVNVYGVLLRG